MDSSSYHIPNFTYPGVDSSTLFAAIRDQAVAAEDAGFERITVMDHFFQLPMLGQYDEPMLECYTLLAALAQHTSRVQLSTMVTGNTYRNPAMLAKEITALDIVSGGRATLAIGAGWYEREHDAMGYEFGTFTDRFEKLEEALQIVTPMLRGGTAELDGKHYQVAGMVNSPAPISRVPILIGGGGEKKTLRMVAQYADESNLIGPATREQLEHKLDVLDAHCDRLGRDRSELAVSLNVACCIAPTMEEADADLAAMAEVKGWDDQTVAALRGRGAYGDPDTVGEYLSGLAGPGLDAFSCSLAVNGHIPGRIALLGEVLAKI